MLHLDATDNLAACLNREIDHIIAGHVTASEIGTCRLDDDCQLGQVIAARNDEAKELLSRSEILAPKPIGGDGTAIAGHRYGRSPDISTLLLLSALNAIVPLHQGALGTGHADRPQ